jgi:endonuclease I
MKKIYSVIIALLISSFAIAQATLPLSWGFPTTALPTGWSEVNASGGSPYYTGSGNPAPAYKLDATNDKLIINFATTPGNLTYDIVGNNTGGPWSGTMLVEESANGTTWTTLRTFSSSLTSSYVGYTDAPNSASRYIRFNFTNKVTGNNIGLDNVAITAGVSANAEIVIKQGTTTIVNGGTHTASSPVSTTLPITFTIQNLGLATLNISSITITGPAAADYILGTFPSTVSGTSSSNFNVDFTPSVSGTRNAVMTIVNNDATANPYIVNLNGVGGSFATEPTLQPSNLTFSNIKSYRFNASFNAPVSAPSGYIILRKAGGPVTDIPVDGTVYQRGDMIGGSMVVGNYTGTSFYSGNIVANTTYHYAVFSYNGVGSTRNYLTTAPLTGSVTSLGSMQPASYYSTVSTSAASFVTDLHNKINTHSIQFYSNYGAYMVSAFAARDTTAGQHVLTCAYSGQQQVYSDPWDWTTYNFSREHTYCYSWMPTTNQALPEYNDYHHLFPTNQNDVNAIRSNYPLGVVVGTPVYTYMGCKLGNNAAGKKVFEPRDADKGDAARAMMYMSVCYTGVSGNLWTFPSYISASINYGQDQDVLKQWHYQDPPDNFEIARNDYVDSLQGNRNPFIDSAQYACYVDFSNMTKIAAPSFPSQCAAIGIVENNANADAILIAPNPNKGNFMLLIGTNKNQTATVKVFDIFGRVVMTEQIKVQNGSNSFEMTLDGFSKGIYTLEFISDNGRTTERIVVE